MKKTLVKFFAGVTAAASLLMAGCTNQLDYLDETVAINKMNITGLSVAGLDKQYNGTEAVLYVKAGDTNVPVVSGFVAGTYTKGTGASAKTLNLKAGTVYSVLSNPYTFDGDKYETSTIEMWLTVGQKTFQVHGTDFTGDKVNAKLSVLSSPAGTSNADLKAKMVSVEINGDDAKYSFESSVTPPTKANLYELDLWALNGKTIAEWNAEPGVNVETSTSTTAYPKYTIKIVGLTNDVGGKYVLCGQAIVNKVKDVDGGSGQWNTSYDGMTSTVNNKGEISWEVYGTAPTNWGDGQPVGPAWKIAKYGTTGNYGYNGSQWETLIPYNGISGVNNMHFPSDITATQDVVLTVDATAMTASKVHFTSASAEPTNTYKIRNIVLKDAPAIGDAGYIAFCAGWINTNEWGASTPNKVKSLTSGDAVLALNQILAPVVNITCDNAEIIDNSAKVILETQILNPASDGDFWADASKLGIIKVESNVSGVIGKTFDLVFTSSSVGSLVEVTE